jgi:hypothetical protein
MVLAGAGMFLTEAYYYITPDDSLYQHLFFLITMGAILPLVLAFPKLVSANSQMSSVNVRDLIVSARFCSEAYEYTTNSKADVYIHTQETSDGTEELIIAFNGTRPDQFLKDMTNINLKMVDAPFPREWLDSAPDIVDMLGPTQKPPYVHKGYLEAFAFVRDKVHAVIEDHTTLPPGAVDGMLVSLKKKYPAKIRITGHSMGGGIAPLAAMSIACYLPPSERHKIHVHTFGAPQVGDGLFVKVYDALIQNQQSIRVTHTYDPVPLVLSSQLLHTKTQFHLSNEVINPKLAHGLDNYIKALEQDNTLSPWTLTKPAAYVMFIGAIILFVKHGILKTHLHKSSS